MTFLRKLLGTAIIAGLGGFLFHLAHIPLPWLIGTITFTMIWKFGLKRDLAGHPSFRTIALFILGINIGSSFTRETGSVLVQHLPYMLLSTLLMIGAAVVFMLLMMRLLKSDLMTAMLSSMPGGLSTMVLMAQETKTANVSAVVFSQTIRVLAIIYTVPFLVVHALRAEPVAAAFNESTIQDTKWYTPVLFLLASLACARLLKKLRFPIPALLGAVTGVIILVLCGLEPIHLPSFAIIAAQILMGISLTDSMKAGGLQDWKKLLPFVLFTSCLLILVCTGIAYLVTKLTSLDFVTAFLSTSAGGIPEMVLTGAVVGANLPVITAYQLSRVLILTFVIPLVVRRLMLRRTVTVEGRHM